LSRPNRTRVLIVLQNFAGGGAERVPLTLARYLDRSRFDVTVFAHENWGPLAGTLPEHVRVVSQNDVYRRHQLPGLLARTVSLAKEHDVLVGANEGRVGILTLLAGRIRHRPVVCWLHTFWEEFGKRTSWRQRYALPAYARADALVAVSRGVAESFARLVGVSASSLEVIYNGLPGDEIRRLACEPLPEEHEAIFSGPTVVNAARLDEVKGQQFLIEAHAALRARGCVHRLVILGEGPRDAELHALAARLGVGDSVCFLGFQQNPYRYMRRSTVFALSSMFEGLPLVLGEAMFCGAPVVSFDCPGGAREVLEDGRAGILVPAQDVTGLAAALGQLLDDPSERARYAALSADRCATFDVSHFAAAWGELLERVQDGRPRTPVDAVSG